MSVNRQHPTAPCSLLRDDTEGCRLVGSYPTCRARPGRFVAHRMEQIGRKALRMVILSAFRPQAPSVESQFYSEALLVIRQRLLATIARGHVAHVTTTGHYIR